MENFPPRDVYLDDLVQDYNKGQCMQFRSCVRKGNTFPKFECTVKVSDGIFYKLFCMDIFFLRIMRLILIKTLPIFPLLNILLLFFSFNLYCFHSLICSERLRNLKGEIQIASSEASTIRTHFEGGKQKENEKAHSV